MTTMLHDGKILGLRILLVIAFSEVVLSDNAKDTNIGSANSSQRGSENVDQIPKEFPSNVRTQSNVSVVDVNGVATPMRTGQLKAKNECLGSIIKAFVDNVIRVNMEKSNSSKVLSAAVHKVDELKNNITDNLMTLMINLENFHGLLSVEQQGTTTEKESATPAVTIPAKEAESDSSSFIVPALIMIILALIFYIGYLHQKIRTLYYRDANILIEEE